MVSTTIQVNARANAMKENARRSKEYAKMKAGYSTGAGATIRHL
jgi:hypothetical protein